MTSIQVDQISKVPDAERRNAMSAIPFVITPTYGLVLGLSKVGLARFGEPERVAAIDSAAGNHTEDALLATTASYEEAVLVTEDHRLRSRAIAEGGEVWWPQEFVDYIRSL
jgi:predicted nucleic acid-binding protein